MLFIPPNTSSDCNNLGWTWLSQHKTMSLILKYNFLYYITFMRNVYAIFRTISPKKGVPLIFRKTEWCGHQKFSLGLAPNPPRSCPVGSLQGPSWLSMALCNTSWFLLPRNLIFVDFVHQCGKYLLWLLAIRSKTNSHSIQMCIQNAQNAPICSFIL